jgi:hypothetical protein
MPELLICRLQQCKVNTVQQNTHAHTHKTQVKKLSRRQLATAVHHTEQPGKKGAFIGDMGKNITRLETCVHKNTACEMGYKIWGSTPAGTTYSLLQNIPTALGLTEPYFQWLSKAISLAIKQPRREANQLPQSIVEY